MAKAFALLLVLTTAIAAGCGSNQRSASKRAPARTCEATRVRGMRTCMNRTIPLNPTIERWTGSEWEVVTGPLPHPEPDGNWHVVALSPDRSTLLADWSYPCDSAAVVFVSMRKRSPRIATGEQDWREAPVAHGVGWTPGGKARVRVLTSWRGQRITPLHPRTFLIDPNGRVADPHPVPQRSC